MTTLYLDGHSLTVEDVEAVARRWRPVSISQLGVEQLRRSRAVVDRVLADEVPMYGISTGFGELSSVYIVADKRALLQYNLIVSHAAGTGGLLPVDTARAVMLLRLNSLCKGFSGVRPETAGFIAEMLNRRVTPAIPCKGSVGASGDLAPLAHMALAMIGEGEVFYNDRLWPARQALAEVGLIPLELAGKEGLALINGTSVMSAYGNLACYDAGQLLKLADIAGAMSLEALKGTRRAFDPRVAAVRPHPGQAATADNILRLTGDSEIIASHANCRRVQDAYSLRCISQVHGASKDAWRRVREVLDTENNSVTDNPLIMPDSGEIISGGNFHGQPVALVMDYAKVATAEIGNIAERRIARLVDPALSGLPPFLTANAGLHSGMMIMQYTAAALVSENKVLCHPASCDSIPTSANQEDHVSMGTIAARQLGEILENVRSVVAIELLCAAQALDFMKPLRPGVGVAAARTAIRELVPHWQVDRIAAADMEAVRRMVADGSLLARVEGAVGSLAV
ncbi:MAG: histidine ammonia-lyase [Negativicutes bacterium]|nr:histidine ammonia-lyase [Negativicutes bacterium]